MTWTEDQAPGPAVAAMGLKQDGPLFPAGKPPSESIEAMAINMAAEFRASAADCRRRLPDAGLLHRMALRLRAWNCERMAAKLDRIITRPNT